MKVGTPCETQTDGYGLLPKETVMLVGEKDARDSSSDASTSQVPMESLHAVGRPAVISDFSNAIPMQSSDIIDSSPNVWSEKMSDRGLDRNKNLSPHNESPVRANELNPNAGGSFASNKPVSVLTMTDDSIGDFHEINGGEQLSLATEIDMEPDDASFCTKGGTSGSIRVVSILPIAGINLCYPTAESLDLLDSCSNKLSEEVSDRGICKNGELLPHKESHIQENELNLDIEDGSFASNKSVAVLTRMNEDMTDLHIDNGNHSLAVEIGTKPDDKNLCGEDGCCDSVQILALNPLTNINYGEREKDEVDFGYQHVNLNREDNVQALEFASHSDKRLVDAAGTVPDDVLIMPVPSFRCGFEDNSKSESLVTSNHVKEGNALNMVEVKSSVLEENCADHENCGIDKELEEHCKCDSLLVDNHVQEKVFNDKLDLEVEELNYDHCRCNGNLKVDERDKETQNAVNIHHQSTCVIENQITDRSSKMPFAMPQPETQLMEDSNTRTSEAVSFGELNVLESSVAESSSGMKYFIVQHDADIRLDDGDKCIDVAREVEDHAFGINMLQNSDLCPTDQLEVQAISSIMDEKCSEVNMLEESRPFDDLHGLVRGFNSLPQFSSSGVGEPPEIIKCVNRFSDSGNFAHSSIVEVSMLEGNAEEVGHVIVEDHTYFDQSYDLAHEKYYGSKLEIDGQANVEEADSISDHISSFFLSGNLFTPFSSHFRRRDGGIECDPSLSTAELLQLSYSEVGKETGLQNVPYSVANLDESPVCDTTDNLCINLSMKDKEIDPTELAELGDPGNMHLADEQHETCCLTNFPFEKHAGSHVTGFATMTDEVEKDGSIPSSCSSEVDERQREAFEGSHLFVVESDSTTINYRFDRHDSENSQDIGAEPIDTEMPRGVAEGQSGKVSKLDTSEKYEMEYTVEETVATAKSDQEKVSYTDETVGSEEEIFTGSVDSSVSDSEHHAGEHSSCDGSSPLLSSQVEYSATSSTSDKHWTEACQLTPSISVGYDFNFRGASKLVDQFDECLAKESEEIRKDEVQPEQIRADKYSDRILTCKRASFQECCGVWDWICGFRG